MAAEEFAALELRILQGLQWKLHAGLPEDVTFTVDREHEELLDTMHTSLQDLKQQLGTASFELTPARFALKIEVRV